MSSSDDHGMEIFSGNPQIRRKDEEDSAITLQLVIRVLLLGKQVRRGTLEVAAQVDSVMAAKVPRAKAPLMGFARQRFDSCLDVCRKFCMYSKGMVMFLSETAELGGSAAPWANDMISFLIPNGEPKNIILLALLTEFLECASHFIHSAEKRSRGIADIAHTLANMKQELGHLFDTHGVSERTPFALL